MLSRRQTPSASDKLTHQLYLKRETMDCCYTDITLLITLINNKKVTVFGMLCAVVCPVLSPLVSLSIQTNKNKVSYTGCDRAPPEQSGLFRGFWTASLGCLSDAPESTSDSLNTCNVQYAYDHP